MSRARSPRWPAEATRPRTPRRASCLTLRLRRRPPCSTRRVRPRSSRFLTGTGVDGTNNTIGIYSDVSGTLAEVVRRGDQAPDAPPGVVFRLRSTTSCAQRVGSDSVRIGSLSGPGVGGTNRPRHLQRCLGHARRGGPHRRPGPGRPGGRRVSQVLTPPCSTRRGRPRSSAPCPVRVWSGASDFGIYSDVSGTLAEVVRDQATKPLTPRRASCLAASAAPALNASGQIAFVGSLTGPDVNCDQRTAASTVMSRARSPRWCARGHQAPDAPAGVVFRSRRRPRAQRVGADSRSSAP